MKKLIFFLATLLMLIGAYSNNAPGVIVYDNQNKLNMDLVEFIMQKFSFDSSSLFLIRFTDHLANHVDGIIIPTPEVSGRRVFHIYIKEGLDAETTSITLIHELVHAFQYTEGDLKEIDRYRFQWKGQVYDTRSTEYRDRPWEEEALVVAHRLFLEYAKLQKSIPVI